MRMLEDVLRYRSLILDNSVDVQNKTSLLDILIINIRYLFMTIIYYYLHLCIYHLCKEEKQKLIIYNS